MGPGLNGSRQLAGAQPPAITTRHTPLDSPCLCESNAANHASTGRELVESLCIMGPDRNSTRLNSSHLATSNTIIHLLFDSPCLCESNAANLASTVRELPESMLFPYTTLFRSRQLAGAQPPAITTRHTPLDSPCLCESNAANHASTGRELVESLCIMGARMSVVWRKSVGQRGRSTMKHRTLLPSTLC